MKLEHMEYQQEEKKKKVATIEKTKNKNFQKLEEEKKQREKERIKKNETVSKRQNQQMYHQHPPKINQPYLNQQVYQPIYPTQTSYNSQITPEQRNKNWIDEEKVIENQIVRLPS